ncbi:MAG: DUF2306 domain-containing protein [Sphingobacteriales bacterium]|nr:DUF2306 domain-containing protein [Sphingobacteriales bacterium]
MLKVVLVYIPINWAAGFLFLKQQYIKNTIWRIAFFTHVFTSMLVLVAGFSQFSSSLLKKKPKLHRTLGYIYVINILFITGPAGLIMSFYANGGLIARISFLILSFLWIFFTAMALYHAINKSFTAHKHFMIRSYALTLSAITLRSWKVIIAFFFQNLGPMDRYRIIAWLGWGFNLVMAELIIQQIKKQDLLKEKIALI